MERFHQERHLPFGGIVRDAVVPCVGNADSIDSEEPSGMGVELPRPGLNVILCVILGQREAASATAYGQPHRRLRIQTCSEKGGFI